MWTKLMVRLWAIRYEKAYRHKAVFSAMIFLAALVILCEVYCIAFCGGLSVFGILALIIAATLLAYSFITRKERRDNDA